MLGVLTHCLLKGCGGTMFFFFASVKPPNANCVPESLLLVKQNKHRTTQNKWTQRFPNALWGQYHPKLNCCGKISINVIWKCCFLIQGVVVRGEFMPGCLMSG